jgi:hypothetical protein
MDCHTDLFGRFIDEMRGMREAVDRLSTSAASSSWAAASSVADDKEAVNKEVGEDAEEEQEEDIAVDVMTGEVGNESGGDEGENKGGEDNDEEGRSGSGGAEWDVAPEASTSMQVADWPHVLQVAERPCVPRPQWRTWKDKGKGKM